MDDWEGENIKMKKIVIHPGWNDKTYEYDFAVVVLESDTILEPYLPTLNSDVNFPYAGTTARVMGWGDTQDGGDPSNVLLEVDIPIISNEDCYDCYGGNITSDMICAYAYGGGVDSCQGMHKSCDLARSRV